MILISKLFAAKLFFHLLQDAQFAAKSLLSYDQLGSQNNWPISHQHPAWKESLQYLSNENTFLRQQLAARADTKFIKGILQHSINNIQLVQVDSRSDLAQHCAELEIEKTNLKEEIFQLRHILNSNFPGAMTVLFFQNQLAAEIRLREYQAIQHESVNQELKEQSAAMERLSDIITGLAKQNHSLQTAVDDEPPLPKQVIVRMLVIPSRFHLHTTPAFMCKCQSLSQDGSLPTLSLQYRLSDIGLVLCRVAV